MPWPKHWTTIKSRGLRPWPQGRAFHSAFALVDADLDPSNPCLIFACGWNGSVSLRDMWVWSFADHGFEELLVPDSFCRRLDQIAGVIHKNSSHAQAVLFGGRGIIDNFESFIAETTVVDLELVTSLPGASSLSGWVATNVRNSDVLACQAIYEDALQHGYVYYRSVMCLLTGVAGSGKTSLKQLMFDKPSPAVRNSTPLAEPPVQVRPLLSTVVDATEEEWEEITDGEQNQLIATEMVYVTSLDSDTHDERSPPSHEATPARIGLLSGPDFPYAPPHTLMDSNSSAPKVESVAVSSLPSSSTQQTDPSDLPLTPTTPLIPLSTEIVREIVSRVTGSSQQTRPRDVDMIYILDSGGQPQFQDIMSLFLEVAQVMIFVLNLSEQLDQYPTIAYYKEGKPIAPPQPSLLRNIEVLQHTVQALQSLAHARQEVQGSVSFPNLLLVGTHRDQEWMCSESQAEKNQVLMSLLCPTFEEHIVFRGEDGSNIIFPVNAKAPSGKDKRVAKQIKRAIRKIVCSAKREKLPVRWHVLEKGMRQLANSLGRGYLTRQECLQLARELHVTEEEFDAAIDRLVRMNLVLYFRHILPGIIFVRPQTMLDKLTKLVQRSYELRNRPNKERSVIGTAPIRLHAKGLVSADFLETFFEHTCTLFTPEHFVRLLSCRLVITEVGDDKYFIPFILTHLSPDNVDEHRVKPSSTAAPLAITFSDGVVPTGLFPALIASLLTSGNVYSLELLPSRTEHGYPDCVYRNCIKFRLPSGTPGSLTLIDSFTHLEAHLDAPPDVASKVAPPIKQAIFSHLQNACSTLGFRRVSCQASFLCESPIPHVKPTTHSITHHAEFSTETNTWVCNLSPHLIYGQLTHRHLVWFPVEAAARCGPSIQEFQCLKWNKAGKQERIRIISEVTPHWRDFGIALGFSIAELDAIEMGCLRDPRACLQKLFGQWVLSKESYSWNGLIEALRDSELDNLAVDVEHFLCSRT